MTGIRLSDPLGAIVTAHPDLARTLEGLGLDYCCGGATPLAEACAEVGLDAGEIADRLDRLASPTAAEPWATMDMVELVDHLERTHHEYLRRELPRLDALLAKLIDVHGRRHPELVDVALVFRAIRLDLEPHLLKEERVLFPMIRELATAEAAPDFHCGALQNPIWVMRREHEGVGDLLARLRRAADGFEVPEDGCASYRACYAGLAELEADTHLHVHKENNVLFPMVERREVELSAG